jgi:hypothetical protein
MVSLTTAQSLPPDVAGLYICGSPTSDDIAALSSNSSMRSSIAAFCASGGVVYGEAGGLAYLSTSVRIQGELFNMASVLPMHVVMHEHPQVQGYVSLRVCKGCELFREGAELRGYVNSNLEVRQEVPTKALGHSGLADHAADVQYAFWARMVDVEPAEPEGTAPAGRRLKQPHGLRGDMQVEREDVAEGYTVRRAVATVVGVSFASDITAVEPLVAACRRVNVSAIATAAASADKHGLALQQLKVRRQSVMHNDASTLPTDSSDFGAPARLISALNSPYHGSPLSFTPPTTTSATYGSQPTPFVVPRAQTRHCRGFSWDATTSLGPENLVVGTSQARLPLPESCAAGGEAVRLRRASVSALSLRLREGRPVAAGRRRSCVWPPRVNGYVRVFSGHDLEAGELSNSSSAEYGGVLVLLITLFCFCALVLMLGGGAAALLGARQAALNHLPRFGIHHE